MFKEFYRYSTSIIMTVLLPLLLVGCGGGGGNNSTTDNSGSDNSCTESGNSRVGGGVFSFSGKIALADGTPVACADVKLFKTSYSIYSTSINGQVYYLTKNTAGVESVKTDTAGKSVSTNNQGKYSFAGMSSGSYTIRPTQISTNVFSWVKIPARSDISVITISQSGMVYIYNLEGDYITNKLSDDGAYIYNTDEPFPISGNTVSGLDFLAAPSGGIGITF